MLLLRTAETTLISLLGWTAKVRSNSYPGKEQISLVNFPRQPDPHLKDVHAPNTAFEFRQNKTSLTEGPRAEPMSCFSWNGEL